MRSFAHRTDANQPEIVDAFRKLGCEVAITSALGGGFPDLVVGKPKVQKLVLVEIKNGSKLTPDEQKFRDAWKGSYAIVSSIADVVSVVRLMLS